MSNNGRYLSISKDGLVQKLIFLEMTLMDIIYYYTAQRGTLALSYFDKNEDFDFEGDLFEVWAMFSSLENNNTIITFLNLAWLEEKKCSENVVLWLALDVEGVVIEVPNLDEVPLAD
ncbi:hypothetical protein ACJX0J_037419, partial [Zea mays]